MKEIREKKNIQAHDLFLRLSFWSVSFCLYTEVNQAKRRFNSYFYFELNITDLIGMIHSQLNDSHVNVSACCAHSQFYIQMFW